MYSFEFFRFIDHSPIAHLIFNRPNKCNAMSAIFFEELPRVITMLQQMHSIRALVISGEGKHFTTGADVNYLLSIMDEVKSKPPEVREQFLLETIEKMQAAFSALANCSMPTIAAVHGLCIGAGIDFIAACDIRLATRSSYFSIMETKLGIPADLGTLQRLPFIISDGILKELAFTSKIFSAKIGHKYGLINHTYFTKKGLLKSAFACAKECCENPFYAVKSTKESINFIHQQQIQDGLQHIAKLNSIGLQKEQATEKFTKLLRR
ncbi:MAG: enoyl-CoA hydratase/isomerase family protein [Oligoflexia bacterium]|nr:enoyl-CoA hydratase/isomerase family protein [Oligoflexia bacterium]MBF0367099.1 enoyl-CoA hydratase/isomerase family protein [Oligoflexia bacterium]